VDLRAQIWLQQCPPPFQFLTLRTIFVWGLAPVVTALLPPPSVRRRASSKQEPVIPCAVKLGLLFLEGNWAGGERRLLLLQHYGLDFPSYRDWNRKVRKSRSFLT
jgi:hypothetical protein